MKYNLLSLRTMAIHPPISHYCKNGKFLYCLQGINTVYEAVAALVHLP